MLRALQFARETLSLLADALQVASIWGTIGSISYFGLVAALGILSDIPWFYIAITAPAAAFLFLFTSLVWMQLKRPDKIATSSDLTGWSRHPVYTVWVASNLWAGFMPNPQIPQSSLAYESLQLIKSHLEAGFIKSLYGGTGMAAKVERDELIKLADKVGARPKFLFPD